MEEQNKAKLFIFIFFNRFFDFFPVKLLLDQDHPAEIIVIKCILQEYNNVMWVRV